MEGSVVDLSKYRYETAKDELDTANELLNAGKYKASVNRSYYAIFHGLRAVTALDNFDAKKHASIISYFNYNYVRTAVFDKSISKLIDTAFRLREKADYQDFFIVSKEQAEEQIGKAERVLDMLKNYLLDRWNETK